MKRLLLMVPVLLLCFAAAPAVLPVAGRPAQAEIPLGAIPTTDQFEHLLQTDPVAALAASLARHQRDVRGYSCILQKQESLHGKPPVLEIIRHTVREEPFAVTMKWEQGAGAALATLYLQGENSGRMKVKTQFLSLDSDPNNLLARRSSRYSIEDAGIANGTRRSHLAWKAVRDAGKLNYEYLGIRKIPELGDRTCYAIRRTCNPLEVDNFRMADAGVRDPAQNPREAIATITLYLDCEHWLQTGSILQRADGSLLAAYYFRDVIVNPAFEKDHFTAAFLKK